MRAPTSAHAYPRPLPNAPLDQAEIRLNSGPHGAAWGRERHRLSMLGRLIDGFAPRLHPPHWVRTVQIHAATARFRVKRAAGAVELDDGEPRGIRGEGERRSPSSDYGLTWDFMGSNGKIPVAVGAHRGR